MNAQIFVRRIVPALLAVFAIGAACAYLILTQVPYGSVSGQVLMTDSGKPLADAEVYLNPGKDDEDDSRSNAAHSESRQKSRRVTTDAAGRFTLRRVPVGAYQLSASAQYHECDPVKVTIREARVAATTLRLKRSAQPFSMNSYQKVWTLKEQPHLPVQGYVDAKKGELDSVRVQVYKTRLSTLLAGTGTLTASDLDTMQSDTSHFKKLPDSVLHPSNVGAGSLPKPSSDTSVPIQSPDKEGFFEQRVVVPTAGPGVYLVQVDHGKDSVCAWVIQTNTGLIVKRAGNRLLTYAVNLITGVPVIGAAIRQYRSGTLVATTASDASGIANVTLPATAKKPKPADGDEDSSDDSSSDDSSSNSAVTVAEHGDDEAVLTANDRTFRESTDAYAVYAYTDRTIYRPGQSIAYKGVVRKKAASGAAHDYESPTAGIPMTVEVRDPSGDRLVHETRTTNAWGSFSGGFELAAEAPTGSYSLITTVNGEKHTTDIAVASYRKPEFAVTVKPEKNHYVRGEVVEMTISAKYYYGAPVAGATVKYNIYRDTDWDTVYAGDSDPEDREENQETSFYGEFMDSETVTLDANGEATVRVETDPRKERAAIAAKGESDGDGDDTSEDTSAGGKPEQQVVTCNATVTDDAKREVEANGQAHLSAGDYILSATPEGYLGQPDKPTSVVVTATDYDGKPVANLPVVLSATYERWDRATSNSETVNAGMNQKATTGAGGSVVLSATPRQRGELNLKVTAYDTHGHVLHANTNLFVSGEGGGDLNVHYSDLSLLTDKKKYGPGETARVLINTARIGQSVLLTVEGDRVYRSTVVPIRQQSTVTRIPIDPTWGPNVTLSACYVRNKKMATSEVPLRVRLNQQTVNVTVHADRTKYRPGDKATYAITTTSAQTGKPVACEVSLAVVDESIFALRPDDPYAQRDAFYPKRTNHVTTSYSFEVAYMGDTDKSEPTIEMRRKFLDTASWQPHLETDANGRATTTVTLPDNLTTWRATVQAVSRDTAIGRTTGAVLVTKPFFLRLDTPRFLTQTDDGRLLALLHNDTGVAQTVHVKLTAPGLLPASTPAEQTQTVAPGTDGQVKYPISAQLIGTAQIRAEAWTEGLDTSSGKPYTDGIETTLPVRAWGREQFTAISGIVANGDGGATRPVDIDPYALPTETKLSVQILPGVGASIGPALDYLVGYPYGCTEQTMSRVYPDLLVQQAEKQSGRPLLRGESGAKKRAELPKMVQNGILRLRRFQHSTGAWGWWTNDEDNAELTSYVLDGLALAKSQGFEVPEAMLENARKGALGLLPKTTGDDRPALLYGLARIGETETGLLRLRAANEGKVDVAGMDLKKLSSDALAHLVLLARLVGADYQPAWAALQRREIVEGELLHWGNATYRWNSSDIDATSLALRAMLALDPHDSRIPNVLRYLMLRRGDGYWEDTRDTSATLAALTDYVAVHPEDAVPPTGTVTVRIDDKVVQTLDLGATINADEKRFLLSIPTSLLPRGKHTLALAGTGVGSTTFYSGALREIVAAPEGGGLPAVKTPDVTIEREYLRVAPAKTGGLWSLNTTDAPGNKFAQDDHLRVRLTVIAHRNIDYVLIEDEYPSNCEPTERGTAEEATEDTEGESSYWYSNIDVRDDRIAFFATHLPEGTHIVEYNLRAQTPGISRALPAKVQAMYAPALRAESADTRVEVTK